jgi:hypothetical protein
VLFRKLLIFNRQSPPKDIIFVLEFFPEIRDSVLSAVSSHKIMTQAPLELLECPYAEVGTKTVELRGEEIHVLAVG